MGTEDASAAVSRCAMVITISAFGRPIIDCSFLDLKGIHQGRQPRHAAEIRADGLLQDE